MKRRAWIWYLLIGSFLALTGCGRYYHAHYGPYYVTRHVPHYHVYHHHVYHHVYHH
ncbi:hypothetical protein [Polycladomyces subterraneus]|uniref:Lipoprotein n=1 Tax=Polycladomyces subterraneus TaxID=1016997 RepID=A0ABT8IL84_9BACL|nr:hypothetical protein [Polycladomyces subterraneus]MDN4593509.1 hypothetical protein [Polycladomyces subterraneus]